MAGLAICKHSFYVLPSVVSLRPYSPTEIKDIIPILVMGNLRLRNNFSSYIKGQKLTMRMPLRRFTRPLGLKGQPFRLVPAGFVLHFPVDYFPATEL